MSMSDPGSQDPIAVFGTIFCKFVWPSSTTGAEFSGLSFPSTSFVKDDLKNLAHSFSSHWVVDCYPAISFSNSFLKPIREATMKCIIALLLLLSVVEAFVPKFSAALIRGIRGKDLLTWIWWHISLWLNWRELYKPPQKRLNYGIPLIF